MLHRLTYFLLAITMNFTTTVSASSEWELVKDKSGIRAYTKSVSDSNHLKFKGVSEVNASLESIVYLMRDMDVMSKWLHSCYDPVVVSESDTATRLIHMKNETPFIVKDRDLVLTQRMIQVNEGRVIVELVGKPGAIEEASGFVRIPLFNGAWQFTRIDEGKTKVEYYGHIDPGGAIPAFITNSMLIDTPYESIRKLKKQKFDKYAGSLDFLVALDGAELDETKRLASE